MVRREKLQAEVGVAWAGPPEWWLQLVQAWDAVLKRPHQLPP